MSDERDIVERLMNDWIAWGAPHNAEEAVNESAMAMRCREAATEITRLRQDLEDVATGKLIRLNAEDGRIDVTLRDGYGLKCLAASFGDYFRSVGATNFLTVDVLDQVTKPDDPLPMTVTIQRKGCKSPSEAIAEKDAEITRLRTELEAERDWKKAANTAIHSFVVFAADVASSVEQLMDFQNGPPLPTYTEGWNDAMNKCSAIVELAQNLAKVNSNPLAAAHIAAAKKGGTE